MTTSTLEHHESDPIDVLVPPPRPWWVRLPIALAIIVATCIAGWAWHFGLVRPAPDCCGSSSGGVQMGVSERPGAVTITAYFFNSSPQAVTINSAEADLPGARVVEIAPYLDEIGFSMPPKGLGQLPRTVGGTSSVWLAISFVPEECTDLDRHSTTDDWGTLTLDLSVAGEHWYPTIDRRFARSDAVAGASSYPLELMASPANDGGSIDGHPLAVACELLGR